MSIVSEIVKQMHIDPELLEQLSVEHREILFRKIREEQVRQWTIKQQEFERKKKHVYTKKGTSRKVNFKLGANGQPWVWVMGEHPNDLSYEQLVRLHEQEEQEQEKFNELQDKKEAEELAKQETRGILSMAKLFGEVRLTRGGSEETDGANGQVASEKEGASVQPSRSKLSIARTESHIESSPYLGVKLTDKEIQREEEERKKTIVRRASLIGATKKQQDDFEKKRAEELFNTMRRSKRIAKKRAAEMSRNVEVWWEESEKKAKDYERTRRSSFKKAREIVLKSPDVSEKIIEKISTDTKRKLGARKPVRPAPPPPKYLRRLSSFVKPGTAPKTPAHVVRWFRDGEAPKGVGREKDGSISIWFQGKINRDVAEKLLEHKPAGSYLVRLSTKIWGYTVSLKSYAGCKHFLVDASHGQYHFMGPKQQKFNTLYDLLRFYRVNPVTWAGQEVLLLPVGQEEEDSSVYEGLYNDDDSISELEESGSFL